MHEQERERVEKYQKLRREIGRLWQLKNVRVVPDFEKMDKKLEVPSDVGVIQETAVLGTARILRRVLEL